MGAVSIGPLVLAADRFSVILGLFAFFIVASILSRKVDTRFDSWAWWAFLAGLGAARLGHVAIYWQSFAQEPWRVFALWEGGFFWPTAAGAVVLLVIFVLKTAEQRLWSLVPLVAALLVWNVAWQLTGNLPAAPLPDKTFLTLAGEPYDLEVSEGRPKVINLWAMWCPPCRREMPMMAEIAASIEGVDFIFANQGENRQKIAQYLSNESLQLQTVLVDPFNDLSRHYGALGLPATLFIGADGAVRNTHLGEISREIFQSNVKRLISDK